MVAEKVGLTLASVGVEGRFGVKLALHAFEWLALLRHGRPFTRLDPERQGRFLHSWTESRLLILRLAARLLLTIIKPVHLSQRAVKVRLGLPVDQFANVAPENPVRLPPKQVVRSLDADTEVRCQVAVIGSGAGGAVVAAELAERGVDVILLEEGGFHPGTQLGRDPLRVLQECYRDGGATVALGRPAIPIPLGKTVGGSTTINSGTCFRVPDWVLDNWERQGLPVDRAHLSTLFDRVEKRISVKEVPEHLLGGSSSVIARGAEALGLSHGPLERNIDGCKGSAVCAFGCPRDAKQSTNITYVPDALKAGARLYSGFRARQVLQTGGRASGVLAWRAGGGPRLTIRADRVVSSCGTIWGVPFLHGSGVRTPHLGRHLTIHPCAKIVGRMPEEVNGWEDTPQGYKIDELVKEGIHFEGAFVPPELTSIAVPFAGPAFTQLMEDYAHLAVFGFMVADEGNGRVWRTHGGRPAITYWISRRDLALIQRGLQLLSEVFFAAGAERIYLPISGREIQHSLAEAQAVLSRRLSPWGLELAAFHPLGTARMSAHRDKGVVDPDLQCWELPGLYVADGSVFPTSLGVNPQVTIMAWATRCAEHLAAKLGA